MAYHQKKEITLHYLFFFLKKINNPTIYFVWYYGSFYGYGLKKVIL
jgi:hypothetical protein